MSRAAPRRGSRRRRREGRWALCLRAISDPEDRTTSSSTVQSWTERWSVGRPALDGSARPNHSRAVSFTTVLALTRNLITADRGTASTADTTTATRPPRCSPLSPANPSTAATSNATDPAHPPNAKQGVTYEITIIPPKLPKTAKTPNLRSVPPDQTRRNAVMSIIVLSRPAGLISGRQEVALLCFQPRPSSYPEGGHGNSGGGSPHAAVSRFGGSEWHSDEDPMGLPLRARTKHTVEPDTHHSTSNTYRRTPPLGNPWMPDRRLI
jgi:hypothetical protein